MRNNRDPANGRGVDTPMITLTRKTESVQPKLWMEQSAAAANIRDRFGLENALQYVLGEKFVNFLSACEWYPKDVGELPAFAAEIRGLFTPSEIQEYLKQAKRRPGSHRRRALPDKAALYLLPIKLIPSRRK